MSEAVPVEANKAFISTSAKVLRKLDPSVYRISLKSYTAYTPGQDQELMGTFFQSFDEFSRTT